MIQINSAVAHKNFEEYIFAIIRVFTHIYLDSILWANVTRPTLGSDRFSSKETDKIIGSHMSLLLRQYKDCDDIFS